MSLPSSRLCVVQEALGEIRDAGVWRQVLRYDMFPFSGFDNGTMRLIAA